VTRLLRIADVAARYSVSVKTVRRALVRRDGTIAPPCMERPWRWREADVERHLQTMSVSFQRQRRLRVAS
jgi:hypothetical protein